MGALLIMRVTAKVKRGANPTAEAKSWSLSQTKEKARTIHILLSKIMFLYANISPCTTLNKKVLCWGIKLPHPLPRKYHNIQSECWRYSSLMMEHNWFNYTDVRSFMSLNMSSTIKDPWNTSKLISGRTRHDPQCCMTLQNSLTPQQRYLGIPSWI